MKNKQTGPTTVSGKKASSKNAIKHGGTSAKLINAEEQDRYESLVLALNNQYQSSNPLVQLQVNRIARVTIQLERIQNVIDASFQKSRSRSNATAKVMESYTHQSSQIEELAGRLFEAKNYDDLEKSRAIAFELINNNQIREIDSKEEFMEKLPLLSTYWMEKEKSSQRSMKELLLQEISNYSESHKKFHGLISEHDQIEAEIKAVARTPEALEKLNLNLLNIFALWHRSILRDFFVSPEEEHLTIQESIQAEQDAMFPEAQEMDRLMRYQTALQRQLSSAIGELLAIKRADESL